MSSDQQLTYGDGLFVTAIYRKKGDTVLSMRILAPNFVSRVVHPSWDYAKTVWSIPEDLPEDHLLFQMIRAFTDNANSIVMQPSDYVSFTMERAIDPESLAFYQQTEALLKSMGTTINPLMIARSMRMIDISAVVHHKCLWCDAWHKGSKTTHPYVDVDNMNTTRAEWAEHAIAAFRTVCHGDQESALGDLLANLLHAAREQGLNPEEVLHKAWQTYRTETNDQQPFTH